MSPEPPGVVEAALLDWRRRLPLVDRTAHLVNHSLGPMPAEAEQELGRFAAEWRERGVRAWEEGWWEVAVATGDLLAPVLGVERGSVAMHPNVTVALGVLLSAIDYPASRPRIVATELDFHTVHYVLHGELRKGAELELLPGSGDGIDLERLLAAIDEHTRLVCVSHVLFRTGFVVDPVAIVRRCREVGALCCLDVYQSAGVLPLELAAWGVDAAVGGSVKWLCGGPGAGYLYVRPELAGSLEPALTGWQADVEPFAFRPGPIRRAQGAWRFLTGTPTVPSLVACRPGYRMVAEVGSEAIRQRSLELTEALIRRADERGIDVRSPRDPSRRGGTVTLLPSDGESVCRQLVTEGILCDHRPGTGLRFGPHFFNTLEECEHAVDRLAEIVGERGQR